MFTNIAAPISAAVIAFTTATLNLVVVLGWWHATPEQIGAVNTFVLSALGLVAGMRAGAQNAGTLTRTPNGNGNGHG